MKTGIEYPALGLVLVLFSANLAQAQAPTESFGDLQSRIGIGEKVQIIDIAGRKTEGRFEGVSGASLRLIADGARQEFLETQIREVRKRRPESRWDGVLIGLGIGVAAGVVNVHSVCNDASERGDCYSVGWAIVLPLFAGGGAGSGALIDFAVRKHDVVFTPQPLASHRFRLAPIVDKQRKGISFSLLF